MKFHWRKTVSEAQNLVDFIAAEAVISKSQVKKALTFGGGWLCPRGQKKLTRVRRATQPLQPGDQVAFYYDEALIASPAKVAQLVLARHDWGIWCKPADMPTQGTTWGDRNSLEAQVSKTAPQAACVHRLDREATGLVLVAYNRRAAAALSALWPAGGIRKFYRAVVEGVPAPTTGIIDRPIEGKSALSHYRLLAQVTVAETACALLEVEIKTGRHHQIRRHLAAIGHPLRGDPRYASIRDEARLSLTAARLTFTCPLRGEPIDCRLPDDLIPELAGQP